MKNILLTALCLATSLIGITAQADSAKADSMWDMPQPTILSKAQTGFNDQPYQSYVQQERVKLQNSNQFRIDVSALNLKYDYNVSTYFINEGASYRNQLGYTSQGVTNKEGVLFKDISCAAGTGCVLGGSQSTLKLGDGVNIGQIAAKSTLDFKLRADGYNRGANAYIFGSQDSKNADGLQHVVAYGIKGTGYILMGFEDLYGNGASGGKFGERSDRDFNDTVFIVDIGEKNVAAFLGQDVPEPSIMLSLLGLSAAGVLKLRRGKAA